MKPVFRFLAVAVTIIVALVAMLWGTSYLVPDLLRVDYGFPFRWGSNTLDTIAGPVNRWGVDLMSLTLDLVFWFVALVTIQYFVLMRR